MKSNWTTAGLDETRKRLGKACPEALAARIYSAQLLGQDPDLVLHGGGNVSVKAPYTTALGETLEAVFVKASGRDMAALSLDDLCPVDLDRFRRLRTHDDLDDDDLAAAMRLCLLNAAAPTPSIETALHALLPQPYIDHSHADAVVALTHRDNAEWLLSEALGDRVAVVPYFRPGLALAQAVAKAYEEKQHVHGIVLMQHGLVTFGPDAKTSYERHVALVDACEAFLAERGRSELAIEFKAAESPEALSQRIAPKLRGLLAGYSGGEIQPYQRSVLQWRGGDALMNVIDSVDAGAFADSGPLTGDHAIRTRARYLYLPDPDWSDLDGLAERLGQAIERFRTDYRDYLLDHGGVTFADVSPNVVMLPGAGLFARGRSLEAARIAADIAERTLLVKAASHGLGEFVGLEAAHVADMECRSLQRAKLAGAAPGPLEASVVVISGGAGAIGCAVGEECACAGAYVVLTDINEAQLKKAVDRVNECAGDDRAFGIVMDVTDEDSVRAGYEQVVRRFGGLDVIVPNAGIAHVAPIENLQVEDFARVMNINATGYLLMMREGIRILKKQGIGGNIVINASKNVFGPGKDFGAYSASKAAGHQLGKVAAIELAPYDIRVNMINADAVFGDEEIPSGLWGTVGPDRAKTRGLATEDLPEYYRGRNLLRARVTGRHVGRAVVFFASNATPTTGATLPVDGGVVEAFPR